MRARLDFRSTLRWLLASGTAAAAAFLLVALHANAATAGIVFLVLIVWFASREGFTLSLVTAALCALAFDYYFLPPLHTFWLVGAQAWIDMFAFAAASVVVSRVAERARRQTLQAQQRRADVERLYALSQEMMLHDDSEALIRDLPRLIGRLFALDAVVLYVHEQDRFYFTGEAPTSLEAAMRSMNLGMQPTLSFESGFHAWSLMLGLRSVGTLAWRPASLSREVAAAVSAQVAIVLARAIAVEASARLEAARESERLRTALVDSLTHELRTPLTSIRAASTTLLQAGNALDAEGRQEMVKIIDEESARLDTLIGEAVEMAEIDAKVIQVRLAPHHPRALLDQAVEESRKALANHHVSIALDQPDQPAWFDPHLLGRVLRHLLENAAAHTPPGSRITLTCYRAQNRLQFAVEDNGPGIEALDLPLIFEKFYRGKRGVRKRQGSGMGLAIVRAILVAHGGGIEASSNPGAGARFRFWVPLIEKDPASPVKGKPH